VKTIHIFASGVNHQKPTVAMNKRLCICFCFVVLGSNLMAQTDEDYVPEKTTHRKEQPKMSYLSSAGFGFVGGLQLSELQNMLTQLGIAPFGSSGPAVQFQSFSQFRFDQLVIGGELSTMAMTGEMSPGTSSFSFTTISANVGYVTLKRTRMDLVPYIGLGVQTALLDIELFSPPVNFVTALTTPTATRFVHVDLILQAGVQYQYYLGRGFYAGAHAGVYAPFLSSGWMYNATALSDYPKFASWRTSFGLLVGLRIP
jgi:hypothetical protein